MWAYVADYVRIKTLYTHGGIYFDTDVSVVKSLDKFLSNECFVGIQCSGEWNYTEPAILGSQKGNKFLKAVLDFYEDGIWSEPIYTMPQIFEKFLQERHGVYKFPPKSEQEIINLKEITLYPERFFIPFEFGQQFSPECVEEDTHTIHWFGGSWCKPEIDFWLRNKHLPKIPSFVKERKYYLLGVLPLVLSESETEKKISITKYINVIKIKKLSLKKRISVFGIPLIEIKY